MPEVIDRIHSSTEIPLSELNGKAEGSVAVLQFCWDRRRWLGKVGAITSISLLAISWMIPNKYESTARLMPPESQANTLALLLGGSGGAAGLGGLTEMLGAKNTGALYVGVIRSVSVQQALVDRFDLKKVYGETLDVDARERLDNNTSAIEDRKNGIIMISVRDRDPIRAAALTHGYIYQLDRQLSVVSTSAARRERTFLQTRLAEVKKDLDEAAKEFSVFASNNMALNVPEQGKAMLDAAARLKGEMIAAQSEVSGLEQIYTANNVRVKAARARINQLQKELDQLTGNKNGTGEVSANEIFPSIRRLPLLGVQYADLYRRSKVEEAVFEALTKQYELAKVQEAREIPGVKVLDDASVPQRKIFPSRLWVVLVGTLLTIVMAILLELGLSWWKNAGHSPWKSLVTDIVTDSRIAIKAFGRNSKNSRFRDGDQ